MTFNGMAYICPECGTKSLCFWCLECGHGNDEEQIKKAEKKREDWLFGKDVEKRTARRLK